MSVVINCGFARVFAWQTKTLARNTVIAEAGESKTSYNRRIQNERYNLFITHFQDFPAFHIEKGINLIMTLFNLLI